MAMGKQPATLEPSAHIGELGERSREIWWFGLERKWWVLAAVGLGGFMSGLNSSVVNTILSIIMTGYGVDLATAEWIVIGYLVVVSGLLLTFGRLGDMIGHRRVYLLGFIIFVTGSVLCGAAPTAEVLIVLRLVQAAGAAMVFASSPAILTMAFPGRQRGQALGMHGTAIYLGLMVGPAIGGYLTSQFGWQSVFLVNLPMGVIGAVLAYLSIADREHSASGERFDLAGAVTFLGGLSCLLLALSHGQTWGWTSATTIGFLVAGAVVLGAFLRIEQRVVHPMLDLSLFQTRLFTTATVSALMNYVCLYAISFLVPFYLIQYRGMNPADAGLLLSSQAILMAVVAPVSGSLSDRIGSRFLSSFGMAVTTAAIAWMGITAGPASSDLEIVAWLIISGMGSGIFVSPNSSALMGSVPRHRQGVASGILGSARNVGMVLGIALTGAVFAITLAAYGGNIGPSAGFLPAFRDTFLVVALCGAIGTATSLMRGKAHPKSSTATR